MAEKIIGTDIAPQDLVAKITGRAKYAEDFRADGMVFAKLLLSPMPHARVRGVEATRALAMPGVIDILRADEVRHLGRVNAAYCGDYSSGRQFRFRRVSAHLGHLTVPCR